MNTLIIIRKNLITKLKKLINVSGNCNLNNALIKAFSNEISSTKNKKIII